MTKHFRLNFRLRSVFCKDCNITYEYFGNGEVEGLCYCCGVLLSGLPVVNDVWQQTKKSVCPYSELIVENPRT